MHRVQMTVEHLTLWLAEAYEKLGLVGFIKALPREFLETLAVTLLGAIIVGVVIGKFVLSSSDADDDEEDEISPGQATHVARLIDPQGRVVHSWQIQENYIWTEDGISGVTAAGKTVNILPSRESSVIVESIF
jgi:hypothetical protein